MFLLFFNLNADVWLDEDTGLIWEIKNQDNIYEEINFLNALSYCENLELDGYSDWWLPSVSQARTLAHFPMFGEYNDDWEEWYANYEPYKNNGFFIKYQLAYNMGIDGGYWAVSEKISFAKSAEDFSWYIDYSGGYDDWTYTTSKNYVRCVTSNF
jgi:hypothetical protein